MVLRRPRALLALLALVALVGGAQAAAGRPVARPGHVVARGETLSELAARLGVSVDDLARANRIADPDRIRAGRRLVVPGRSGTAGRRGKESAAVGRRGRGASDRRGPDELRRQPARLAMTPRFDAAARDHGVPADLLKAVAWQESGWQNHKVSSTQAVGIGQLMPDTVSFVNERLLGQRLDPSRPEQNIVMSARFLRYLLDQTNGDVPMAVGAYYQGLASVQRNGPLRVTESYVANVLALRAKF